MKKSFTLITLLALLFNAHSQQLQNGGFENWTGNNPNNWSNIDALVAQFGITTDLVQQVTTNVPVGNYCIKLLNDTVVVPGQGSLVLPGILSIGPLSLSQADGIVWGKTPYAFRPDSLSFLYKLVLAGADTAGLSYSLTKNGAKVGGLDPGFFVILPPSPNFTRVTIPFDYVNTNTPDSLSLTFISSLSQNRIAGTSIWLDDVKVIGGGGSVGLEDLMLATSVKVYPNPASDVLNISVPEKFIGYTVQITDAQGRIVDSREISAQVSSISLNHLANGQYFTRIISAENGVVRQDQITIVK